MKWWTLSEQEIADHLKTDLHSGLKSEEIAMRRKQHGYNELPEPKKISLFKLLLAQFSSFIILVLIAAAIIAGILGEWVDATAIGVIVLLNGIIGFFQEYRAEKSIALLRKMANPTSKVVRGGILQNISSRELVPGDLLLLEAGDRVPADGRIIQATELSTQEAALTGESVSIHKMSSFLSSSELTIGDRKNMSFMGTTVVTGKGYMIVTEIALKTELGKIASLLQEQKEEKTPLQIRLAELGKRLVWMCLGIIAVVFILGLLRGTPFIEDLLISVSLAVAAIPEGLPAVVTVALAIGVRKMAKRNALVRRLASVETLGCTTVICTDKTGTLTQNEMVVRSFWVNRQFIEVTGIGYKPEGTFEINHQQIDSHTIPELMLALKIGILCNNAGLYQDKESKAWTVAGDPTEGALLVAGGKADLFKESLDKTNPILGEIPFDSERKRMGIARQTESGSLLFVKGAPDIILNLSTAAESDRKEILEANAYLASQGLRVLGLAYKSLPQGVSIDRSLEKDLIFVGLVAMMDPPRPEVKQAIAICQKAGIRAVMITGDHKETAIAVAKELKMMTENSIAISGVDLEKMDDEELKKSVKNISVYARASAEHKIRIVHALRSQGEVVAMTGDGVNDAPAIKEADIGVAMGLTGTDVTKEASDMVILDDNFASIVNAVEEGRGIYDNIMKFVNYLLSSNIAELLVIFLGMLFSFKDPLGNPFVSLAAVQLLWLNLVTDGFPAIALGMDPVDPKAMERKPRRPNESIFSFNFSLQLFSTSILIALGTLFTCHYGLRTSAALAQTMALTTLVVLELVKVYTVRMPYHLSLFSNPMVIIALISSLLLQLIILYVPPLQVVFKTVPLHFTEWGIILVVAAIIFLISIGLNHFFRRLKWKSRE